MIFRRREPREPIFPSKRSSSDLVALILALGIAISLIILTCAAIGLAINEHGPLSENATQILTGWGGGMLGVLGAYVGYAFGKQNGERAAAHKVPDTPRPPDAPSPPIKPPGGPPGGQQ